MAKVGFDLEQWNTDALRVASGGGTVVTAGTGVKFTPHAAGTISEWVVVVDITDGDITDRYVITKVMTTSSFETQLTRTELSTLPAELEAIGEDGVDPWFMFSSDTDAFTVT